MDRHRILADAARGVGHARRRRRLRSAYWQAAGLLLLLGCRQPSAPASDTGPRVVSLAPSLTEIIIAIGATDRLVGRTSACDYPPDAVDAIPVIGDFGRPSVERVLAMGPTLVVDADLEDRALRSVFRRHGAAVHAIPCRTHTDILEAIRTLGRLLHREAEANALAETIEADLARLRALVNAHPPETRPRVFIELWPDPLMTVGRGSFVHELVAWAGGRNIAEEANRDYFTVDPEWVVTRDPDVILVLHDMGGADPAARLARRPGWSHLRAVRERRVIADVDPDLLQRPGPRIAQGVARLHERLYAPGAAP